MGTFTVLFAYLNDVSLSVLGAVLFIVIVASAEFGLAIGRRVSATVDDKDASTMASAALGLLALLIAFTYSMAVARYDQRRSLVLQEANAIGSTANFALMLPAADQAPALDLLRQYTQVRLNLGVPYDNTKMDLDIKQSTALLGKLWQNAVNQSASAPQSLPLFRYVASLNETNNIAEARLTGLRNHVPVMILMMLAGTALIAMGFVGYSTGVSMAKRQVPILIMSALIAFVIVVTQDLARPERGAIDVPTQPLKDALAALPAPALR